MDWYFKVLKQYADFNGRARRTEYWMFVIFNIIFGIIISIIDWAIGSFYSRLSIGLLATLYAFFNIIPDLTKQNKRLQNIKKIFLMLSVIIALFILDISIGKYYTQLSILGLVYYLAMIVPGLAVSVRRLHDVGKSGWFLLIGFFPLIGSIWLLILSTKDSDPGNNDYGPNPKDWPPKEANPFNPPTASVSY